MSDLSFGGVGSGLDIAGIVNQLVSAERSGTDARINRTLSQSNAQISALGNFRAAADALQRQVTDLTKTGLTQFAATVQKDSPFSATASDKAQAGTYAVTVQQRPCRRVFAVAPSRLRTPQLALAPCASAWAKDRLISN